MTAAATFVVESSGSAVLHGPLDFTTVPTLWPEIQAWLARNTTAVLSLGAVTATNSAALALLLEAIGYAKEQAVTFTINDIPTDLLDLARLSNVDKMLQSA